MLCERSVFLPDETATVAFGQMVGEHFLSGVIFLKGDLGAGKTTLCRGILQARGHRGAVKSPTYTLVEPYELSGGTVYHFDLYRLGDPEELEYMGVRDYFDEEALCIIEWPERGEGVLPVPDSEISLRVEGSGRRLVIMAHTTRGQQLIDAAQRWQAGS
jgi:tRNA threonylcarbamoyladenosine biosynthesis protein TsaE